MRAEPPNRSFLLNSINTNKAALAALQALNANARDLQGAQTRVATGLRIASAKDDGALWGIAKMTSGEAGASGTVAESLSRARSALDVASSASDVVMDLVGRIQDKALAYQDPSLNASSRASLRADIEQMLGQVSRTVSGADFDGMNLINGDYAMGITHRTAQDSYNLQSVVDRPQSFSTLMQRVSGLARTTTTLSTTTQYRLPYSPLTPDSFASLMTAHAGGTVASTDRIVSGSGTQQVSLTDIYKDADNVVRGPFQTAGRVEIALDAYVDSDIFELWQGGVRVAASGQASAGVGAAVGPGAATTGQSVLAFDYDPAKGAVQLRTTGSSGASAWAVDAISNNTAAAPPVTHTTTLGSVATVTPLPPVQLDPETSGAMPGGVASTIRTVDGGAQAGRVDLIFDAFDTPDQLEIWQNGVRVAASGQAYAPGGGAVGAATPTTGPQVISFDYDPAAGQALEFRFNQGYAAGGGWAVGGPVLQATSAARPSLGDVSMSTYTNQLIQTGEDPYEASTSTPVLSPETAYDGDGVATYTLDAGAKAGRVDMLFDAFDNPDTVEIWQNGVRVAASGQAYAGGGGAVAGAVPVTGAQVISFDYDPAAGQTLEFRFNDDPAVPGSAWTVGALAFQDLGSPLPSTGHSRTAADGVGPIYVEYNPLISTRGDTLRLKTRNLTPAFLGLDPIDWDDPGGLLRNVKDAMAKVTEAGAYLGERQSALSGYIDQFQRLQDTLRQGIGNLVDADLAKEAARLESAKTRLGISNQVLSIANAAPQWLQRLFRPQ